MKIYFPRLNATLLLCIITCSVLYTGCGPERQADSLGKLRIVATTTIIGDVVRQVAGDRIDLQVLLPVGASPHSFETTPRDVATLSGADIIFVNGVGLEAFLENVISSAGVDKQMISVSRETEPRFFEEKAQHHDHNGHDHGGEGNPDPHVWTSPVNVISWVGVIEETLSGKDSLNRVSYAERARAYKSELDSLDRWIRRQVNSIPEEHRKLVTDHLMFGYFCDRYGLDQVGAIIPSFSTLAEPSARDFARLEDTIHKTGVKAVFVGMTVNPTLAEQISRDTKIELHRIYTGSLGPQGSEAETYIDYMKYNVRTLTEALSGNGSP